MINKIKKFITKAKPVKLEPGDLVIYISTGDIVEVVEHSMPKMVTIKVYKNTKIYSRFIQDCNNWIFINDSSVKSNSFEITVDIQKLEILPDKDITKLLY